MLTHDDKFFFGYWFYKLNLQSLDNPASMDSMEHKMFICKSRPVQGMHQYVAKGRFYKLLFLNGDLYAWPSVLKKEKNIFIIFMKLLPANLYMMLWRQIWSLILIMRRQSWLMIVRCFHRNIDFLWHVTTNFSCSPY